jgi:hypothetical protein
MLWTIFVALLILPEMTRHFSTVVGLLDVQYRTMAFGLLINIDRCGFCGLDFHGGSCNLKELH